MANVWHIPEKSLKDAVTQTVDAAMRTWPAMIAGTDIDANQKGRLLRHIEANASVLAWRRNAKSRV